MTDKKYISWRVIARRLLDKATREECEQVEAWLKESEENKIYYRKAKRYFDIYYTGAEDGSVDMERAWEEFLRYTDKVQKRVEWKKWMRIVAAIFLPLLIVGGVFWYSGKKDVEDVKVAQSVSIGPGKIKAVLQVVSGAEITLSDTVNVVQMARQINERQEKSAGAPLQEDASIKYNTIIVPKGGEYSLALADGTRIVLNSDSRLRFPEYFGKNGRGVFLEGEAYFEVAKDSSRPFVVGVQESFIQVLGTSFNVKGYKDDSYIQTTLVEGKVCFKPRGNEDLKEISPGEQVTYDKNTGEVVVKEVNPNVYAAWVKGVWIVEGMRLDEMMKQVSRWYDVTVFYQNPEAKELVFTGDLERYDNCEDILHLIEMTTNVRFEIKDRRIIVKYDL